MPGRAAGSEKPGVDHSLRTSQEGRPRKGGGVNFRTLDDLCRDFRSRRTGEPSDSNEGASEQRPSSGGGAQADGYVGTCASPPAPTGAARTAGPAARRRVDEASTGISPSSAPRAGVLKKLFREKGFGFIAVHGSQTADVFLHFSDICNGGSEDMATGIHVRFDAEVDPKCGKIRARNAVLVVGGEAFEEGSTASEVPAGAMPTAGYPGALMPAMSSASPAAPGAYGLGFMLRSRQALLSMGALGPRPSHFRIGTVFVPWRLDEDDDDAAEDGEDEEELDDEACVAALEVRLSAESGADRYNSATFGEDNGAGWSYEEALRANAALSAFCVPVPAYEAQEATALNGDEARERAAQLVEDLYGECRVARGSAARALTALLASDAASAVAAAAVAEGAAEALTAVLADPGAGDEARNAAACAIARLLDLGGQEALEAAVAAGAIDALQALVADDEYTATVDGRKRVGSDLDEVDGGVEATSVSSTASPSFTSLRAALASEDMRTSSESDEFACDAEASHAKMAAGASSHSPRARLVS